jgi:hypothetical protein
LEELAKWNMTRIQRTLLLMPQICRPWLDVGTGDSLMRDTLKKIYGEPDTYQLDLDMEPYVCPDNHFMTITSFEMLEHLYNPLYHLLQLRRILNQQGKILMTTPNDYSLIYKLEHLLSRKYGKHFHQFSVRDMEKIVSRAGMRIIRLKKFFKNGTGTVARISRNGLYVEIMK